MLRSELRKTLPRRTGLDMHTHGFLRAVRPQGQVATGGVQVQVSREA